MTGEPLLDVRDLKVSFRTEDGLVKAVDGVSLTLFEGETLGIVGESGSGKSVTMMSVMRLINDPNARFEGEVLYKGHDLMTLNRDQMRAIRGTGISMIFQDPMTSLNPVYRVGAQIAEQIRAHDHVSKQAARDRAIELLAAVGIPQAAERVDNYPHEFSGGMRQRVMIAMAVSCNPDILIADESHDGAAVQVERDVPHRVQRVAAADPEVLAERDRLHGERPARRGRGGQRRRGHAPSSAAEPSEATGGASGVSGSTNGQAVTWSGSRDVVTGNSCMSTSRHAGLAYPQRGANGQPAGGSRKSGGEPGMPASSRRAPRSDGNELSRPLV